MRLTFWRCALPFGMSGSPNIFQQGFAGLPWQNYSCLLKGEPSRSLSALLWPGAFSWSEDYGQGMATSILQPTCALRCICYYSAGNRSPGTSCQ